ncbi:MAG: sigma-70 family RNA polymerase sigma factor [Gemmatimonadetes bacterium]|nr:sigma-70 family RNA polymerase sigma factor [Gemmatimonadota bacterium]
MSSGWADRRRRADFEREALPQLLALYYFALRLAGDEALAEDLVQDACLRAYRSWDRYTPGTNCKAWLMTILYRLFLDRSERARRRVGCEGEAAEEPGLAVEPEVEAAVFDRVLDAEVQQALDQLPERLRAVVVLSDLEELRYAEIAEILSIPEGTVKSRLSRGREQLRSSLLGYAAARGYGRNSASAELQRT